MSTTEDFRTPRKMCDRVVFWNMPDINRFVLSSASSQGSRTRSLKFEFVYGLNDKYQNWFIIACSFSRAPTQIRAKFSTLRFFYKKKYVATC